MPNRALITGITGQDGSFLAELLLEKGYEVHGIVRRSASPRLSRLHHLKDRITLHQADLLDAFALLRVVKELRPREVYNLAAQSFVPASFADPVATGDVTALGVARLLEAIRLVDPEIRFYQASSSEMFGKAQEVSQRETTPFHPRSPYGVAKVYGHYITVNAREAYGMHASCGILFNHECLVADTPVIVRRRGLVDVVPIKEIVPHRRDPKSGIKWTTLPVERDPIEVWDRGGWTKVLLRTATWNRAGGSPDLRVHRVAARGAVYSATAEHRSFKRGPIEVATQELRKGDAIELIEYPPFPERVEISENEAWLLGLLAADGYVSVKNTRVTMNETELADEVADRWGRLTGQRTRRRQYPSQFGGERDVIQLDLVENSAYLAWLRSILYTRDSLKRIPKRVLNANADAQLAFLRGYNRGDGLRAGHCNYEFKSWKTDSPVLAAGLCWLASRRLEQRFIVCLEDRDDRTYYTINLNTPNPTGKGAHLRRPDDEVLDVVPRAYTGWLFDLETESGTFHAGVGRGYVHNSPRRGFEFVTRKISSTVAFIRQGHVRQLKLGNLDARRDWGHARDYVRAMWLMLQQDVADDYVVATGTTHSVREFAELAFAQVGLDWREHVVTDDALLRPAEVDQLRGDATKATAKLGWKPEIDFRELVTTMVTRDMERLTRYGPDTDASPFWHC